MKVFLASDHAGYALKMELVQYLKERGIPFEDLGTHSPESVDYPDFAHRLAEQIRPGPEPVVGILVCATGIGMSIAANKHRGVRASLCHDAYTAEMARRHNDANVLCLGGRTTGPAVARQIVDIFLATPFDGGRHARRVAKLEVQHE
ncbi:MAG: ribose 5-phosphate isomerase B [Thermoanaerobaculaceae bacterium]